MSLLTCSKEGRKRKRMVVDGGLGRKEEDWKQGRREGRGNDDALSRGFWGALTPTQACSTCSSSVQDVTKTNQDVHEGKPGGNPLTNGPSCSTNELQDHPKAGGEDTT